MDHQKFLLFACLFLFHQIGCKKEDDGKIPTKINVDTLGRIIFEPNIDGAFYCHILKSIFHNPDSTGMTVMSQAWVEDFDQSSDNGIVKMNGKPLNHPTSNYLWYLGLYPDMFENGKSIFWEVEGNNTITEFKFYDNSSMPNDPHFALDKVIDITKSFLLKHIHMNAQGVIYSVNGSKGSFQKFVEGNSKNYTFSASDLSSAALPGELIFFSIAGVNYEEHVIDGKNYVFVKVKQVRKAATTK